MTLKSLPLPLEEGWGEGETNWELRPHPAGGHLLPEGEGSTGSQASFLQIVRLNHFAAVAGAKRTPDRQIDRFTNRSG